eukprot:NODE_984_length_2554_cov_0.465580.p2 type:complete len:135 gc:universal NODE_984_length_2554_cov_0.465580:1481-1077(-)
MLLLTPPIAISSAETSSRLASLLITRCCCNFCSSTDIITNLDDFGSHSTQVTLDFNSMDSTGYPLSLSLNSSRAVPITFLALFIFDKVAKRKIPRGSNFSCASVTLNKFLDFKIDKVSRSTKQTLEGVDCSPLQ